MNNHEISSVFDKIADLMEIRGDVIYKILAYRRAAENIAELGRDLTLIQEEGKLTDIPGIGQAISEKIEELLNTGSLEFLEKLEAEVPPSLIDVLEVPGLGPKRVSLFWQEADVTNLEELEIAAKEKRLSALEGIGIKTEANILKGIQALKQRSDRITLGKAWPFAQEILTMLEEMEEVEQAAPAGSLRRMRDTVGDLDLLAASSDPDPVMAAFVEDPRVQEIVSQGQIKSSVIYHNGLRAQLWVHPPERFGTALQYATGAKDHNVKLRELAQKKGFSLSEHSITNVEDQTDLYFSSEEEVYSTLGLPWIPPELREDRGEIEAAEKNQLPELIHQEDIRSELHSHSTWSDGTKTIREMAQAALERGYKIFAITDHSKSLGIAGGISESELLQQREEIRKAQDDIGNEIKILAGIELEILADGSLDFSDQVLSELDLVIASLHTSTRQPREQVTRRLLNAIENPHVDIIAHPTNRLIGRREPADLDLDAVIQAAAENQTALEINSHPQRLDLADKYVRRVLEVGGLITINTDAHTPGDFEHLRFGIATARRGWAVPERVINTWDIDLLQEWLDR
jgi:DNA polymerase (family 10)